MSGDRVRVARDGAVATLTLNRPRVLNALDPGMAVDLARITGELARDDAVRCVIVTGAGDHFMAGGDIGYFRELVALAPQDRQALVREMIRPVHDSIRNIHHAPKPVVASVRGACAGFGLSLMMACDLALATEDASLSVAYCRIGASPDGGATHFLPRLAGARRAMELALLGDRIDASRALELGLVNRVVAAHDLERETQALAERLARGPAAALARTRRLLRESTGAALETQLRAEEESFVEGVAGAEFAEGVTAFLEKRPPRF